MTDSINNNFKITTPDDAPPIQGNANPELSPKGNGNGGFVTKKEVIVGLAFFVAVNLLIGKLASIENDCTHPLADRVAPAKCKDGKKIRVLCTYPEQKQCVWPDKQPSLP